MNLSEETIKHLEQKAFLRGLERAVNIADETADELWDDCANRSGARSVLQKLEDEVEKLQEEIEPQ